MTLNDIIVSALSQLDRGHDSQNIDLWRDRMTRFANEAVGDLAHTLQLRRSDPLNVVNGQLSTTDLPRHCVKVLSLWREGKRIPFIMGTQSGILRALCPDGEVQVTYRYLPLDMTSPTDVPEVPEWCHGMIVTYVVARERVGGDPNTQRGANIYFQLYRDAKRSLRRDIGEADACRILNRY